MSLEDAINRLANAIAMDEKNAAVREIIRQRDAWQAQAERNERRPKAETERAEKYWADLQSEGRKNRSLRGVVTRMKKAATERLEGKQ